MNMTDRINRANARSRRIPSLVFRTFLGVCLSGIVMALLVPMLHRRGVPLQAWMAWTVIVAGPALSIGPDLVRRFTSRD